MPDSPIRRTGSPCSLPEEDKNNTGLNEQTEQALNASGQQQLASALTSLPHELAHGQQHAPCCPACSASVCAQHALCALTNVMLLSKHDVHCSHKMYTCFASYRAPLPTANCAWGEPRG